MKKLISVAVLTVVLSVAAVVPASAAPPCNDANGDGSPSGVEFAQSHIVPLATAGMLGEGGHKPGTHMGFSICLGVH